MNEHKHTPPPWILEEDDDCRSLVVIDQAGVKEWLLCDQLYYPSVNLTDPDWHLMAAAPLLLDALEKVEFIECDYPEAVCPQCFSTRKQGHLLTCTLNAALKAARGEESEAGE